MKLYSEAKREVAINNISRAFFEVTRNLAISGRLGRRTSSYNFREREVYGYSEFNETKCIKIVVDVM